MRWLGTTYAWGGGNSSGPTLGIRDGGVADRYGDYKKVGFDCSGLALYAWAQVGVYLPHYSGYQYSGQPKVSRSQLQPGDLVFFAHNTSDPSTIHHVAIWMGNDQIVEAPNSGSVRQDLGDALERLHRGVAAGRLSGPDFRAAGRDGDAAHSARTPGSARLTGVIRS